MCVELESMVNISCHVTEIIKDGCISYQNMQNVQEYVQLQQPEGFLAVDSCRKNLKIEKHTIG